MGLPFTGGCAWGAIRYECTAEPMSMFNCHYRDCHHAIGAGHACVVIVLVRGATDRAAEQLWVGPLVKDLRYWSR
jgi:hypothetical protein